MTGDETAVQVRTLRDRDVDPALLDRIRRLVLAAFGDRFDEHDWDHCCGGWRTLAWVDDELVAHAAVVPRTLHVGDPGRPLRTGYLEAVATAREHRGHGFGTAVVHAAGALVREQVELGALSTGAQPFYERLGWRPWRGPSYVRPADGGGPVRTADEDAGLMVLLTESTAGLDLSQPLTCEERPGDDW